MADADAPSVDVCLPKAVTAHFTGLVGNLTPLGMIGGDLLRAAVASNGSSGRQPSCCPASSTGLSIPLPSCCLRWPASRGLAGGSTLGSVFGWHRRIGVRHRSIAPRAARAATERKRTPHGNPRCVRDVGRASRTHRTSSCAVGLRARLTRDHQCVCRACRSASRARSAPGSWRGRPQSSLLTCIGIAGIGVREAALVALLRPLGGAPGPVMAAGLLWDAVIVIGALAGWLLFTWLPALRHVALRRIALRRIQTP